MGKRVGEVVGVRKNYRRTPFIYWDYFLKSDSENSKINSVNINFYSGLMLGLE